MIALATEHIFRVKKPSFRIIYIKNALILIDYAQK